MGVRGLRAENRFPNSYKSERDSALSLAGAEEDLYKTEALKGKRELAWKEGVEVARCCLGDSLKISSWDNINYCWRVAEPAMPGSSAVRL